MCMHTGTCKCMHDIMKVHAVKYLSKLTTWDFLGFAFVLTVFAKKPMCAVAIAIYEPVPAHYLYATIALSSTKMWICICAYSFCKNQCVQ